MVHSHGIRGGVVNLAPMTLGSSSMVGGWGTSGLHGRLHAFVKRALLQQLVTPGASVCDLFCGRGIDTANWAQAGIGNYIGIDLSASALEEAREQWDKHCQPFPATFHELDPCTGNLELLQDAGLPVDVVTCFAHLQDYFASEDMVRLLLRNVVSLLKPGGYFFGTTPDSSTIWYKYQKAVEEAMKVGSLRVNGTLPRVRSPLYTITFEDDRFQFFGSKYQLRFVDGLPAQMQQLVHFPSFIRLAEEVGLEYVEIQNLTEFYDDYRVPFASTLQSSCKNLLDQKGQPMVDSRGKLSMVATDVLSLYSTFIFKRSARVVRPASYLDFQLDTEFLFGRDLEKSNPKSECSPGMSLRFAFTPEPSPRDSSPVMKREGFSLSSGEEYMSSQEDLFDRAPTKEEFPVYIIQDSGSPTGRIETSHPEQVTDTPDSDQFFPVVDFPCDKDYQLDFQETDHVAEDKSADLEERDRSVTAISAEDKSADLEERDRSVTAISAEDKSADLEERDRSVTEISPTVEGVEEKQEQQEQREETEALAGEECEQPQADEVSLDENLLTEEVPASSQRTSAPKKARLKGKKKKRTARFCPTAVDLAVTGQTCSINYQSEVEQEAMDADLEVSVPAPPPFLFYQRKKRTEAGLSDGVVQEASVSTNTGNLRALRPRRSSSVGDPKSAPAVMTKGARSSKVDNNSRAGSSGSLIFTEEEPGDFSSDGALAGGRGGGVPGKARGSTATLKEGQLPAQAPHDAVANGRRSTRSCSSNIVQGIGECRKGTTSESSTMVIRMTRMRSSNLRSSF